MTDQPIDPAATPEDPAAPEIAADDAGASAAAERAAKQAADDRGDAGVNAGDGDALNPSVSARAAARDEERPISNSEA
ncbi:hypothetical protein [uncultured Brevundimonas sp.]|uniref:hypothetical protein n=1 Tax=uncultured Brevundimonas sp. TaxID=213418 RepID=UPI0026067C78|nr:hypothetical protein [uncultured Brevundimonas sp.]